MSNSSGGMVHIRRFWTTQDKTMHKEFTITPLRQRLLWGVVHDQRNKLMIDVVNMQRVLLVISFGDDSYSRFWML